MHPTPMTTATTTPERKKKAAPTGRIVVPFEVKATDTSGRTFEGDSATTGRDLGGDIIHPGAFARTLDHWRASGGPEGKGARVINLLDQHAYKLSFAPSVVEHTLGRLIEAEERTVPTDGGEDETVLWSKFLVARTQRGDDLLSLIEDRHATRLSIGWKAVRFDFSTMTDEDGNTVRVRNIYELMLGEISVVMFAMNPQALIDVDSVKAVVEQYAAGELNDDDRSALKGLHDRIGTLLEGKAPESDGGAESKGVPPDDPRRLEAQAIMRDVELRRLARPLARAV